MIRSSPLVKAYLFRTNLLFFFGSVALTLEPPSSFTRSASTRSPRSRSSCGQGSSRSWSWGDATSH